MVIVGRFAGTADFDGTTVSTVGSPQDAFIAKYDSDGNLLWIRHAGGISTGGSNSGSNSGLGVTTDGLDNVIATGTYIGSATFSTTTLPAGGANEEMFLVKYSTNGNLLWAKAATGPFSVLGRDVSTDAAGNIYVIGHYGHHNFGGSITFAATTLPTFGGTDIFIAKYDPNGTFLWARHAGSSNTDFGRRIATDGSGDSVIVGSFQSMAVFGSTTLSSAGSFDVFVAKYDTNGSLLWGNRAGGTDEDRGTSVALDNSGNFSITGSFRATADFGSTMLTSVGANDIFVAKYDASGNVLWAGRAGDATPIDDADYGFGVTVDDVGSSFVTGKFQGTAGFGSEILTSLGGEDIFVAKQVRQTARR